MPHLKKLMDELADEPVSLLMVTDEADEKIEPFLDGFEMPGWVVIDEDSSTFDTFKVKARPRTIVLDTGGTWLLDLKPDQLDAELVRRVIRGEVRSTEIYAGIDPIAPELDEAALPPEQFGEFELITGTESPIRTGYHGLASPGVFDYDGDGKKDLWVGEFETGPSLVKVFRNVGTNEAPEFTGESVYAKTTSGKNIFIDSW